MDGYKQLAAAIVERAVIDYRVALKRYDDAGINSLEKFFQSEWFMMLSDLNGKALIHMVKEMEAKS